MAAAYLEHDVKAKKRVMRKALEHIPTSNKARRAVPINHEIWIATARLLEQEVLRVPADDNMKFEDAVAPKPAETEEERNKELEVIDKTLEVVIRELRKHQVELTREQWLKEAESSPKAAVTQTTAHPTLRPTLHQERTYTQLSLSPTTSGFSQPFVIAHLLALTCKLSSMQRCQKSIEILNEHSAPANIQFKLNRVDHYGNERWYMDVGVKNPEAFEMRAQTHVRDGQTLNIWTTGYILPYDSFDKATKKDDGIVMRRDFFADSGHPIFNDGRYLAHEVGRWVGLFHIFEGGPCNDYNDGVDDTPAQYAHTYIGDSSCTPANTCPDTPGVDPIRPPSLAPPLKIAREASREDT
ncbi:hypothetical protein BKA70DRAFT_1223302 [Coprinopsis sp. MPI-PUGE-AT-0042]|nr:hypothetical protein BKA70DRAFT_1223302 [Coprinopsis sp. MPI-PUGE-AT-0042]